jgi:hypothetical protein
VRPLSQLLHEPLEHRGGESQQPALRDHRRVGEDARADTVGAGLRVALGEAVLRERAQRPRRLALVDTQPAGDVDHAQAGVVGAAGK